MNMELLTSIPAKADEVVKKLFENDLWNKFDGSASCKGDYETKGNTFKIYLEGDHNHTHYAFDCAVIILASKLGYLLENYEEAEYFDKQDYEEYIKNTNNYLDSVA